jgi:flagellar hook assembly protein FlgD
MEADWTPPVAVPGNMVQIHPNPFTASHGAAAIQAMLPRPSRLTVAVFDASSRWVRTLHSGPGMSGANRFEWNGRDESGRDLPAGVYFVRLTANGAVQTRKMVMIR